MFLNTNVTLSQLQWVPESGGGGYWTGQAGSVFAEGLFYDSSYQLSDYSIDCRGKLECPINGEIPGVPNGTVNWVWALNQPEFPYPAGSPLAEITGPAAPTHLQAVQTNTSIEVSWNTTSRGTRPLLNYTLYWGTTTELGHSVNLLPSDSSCTLAVPPSSRAIYLALRASNLHGAGPPATLSLSLPWYSVAFQAVDLPGGSSWSVTLNGTTETSTADTITFSLPNGTYVYTVASPGYQPNPESGTLTIDGAGLNVGVSFSPATYAVTFAESGLSPGTSWTVTFDTVPRSSTGSTIPFLEPSGTYPFIVASPSAYAATPGSGVVIVYGTSVTQPIGFTAVPNLYTAYFTASGAPLGTRWTLNFNGTYRSTNQTDLEVANVVPGVYVWNISGPSGYTESPGSGVVRVTNESVSLGVAFSRVTFTVTFAETGLPQGTLWAVDLNGVIYGSTSGFITFRVVPGTFDFLVGYVNGWLPSPTTGTVSLIGATTVEILFVPT